MKKSIAFLCIITILVLSFAFSVAISAETGTASVEAKIPDVGIDPSGLPAYTTQKTPAGIPATVEAWVKLEKSNGSYNVILSNLHWWNKNLNAMSFTIQETVPTVQFGILCPSGTSYTDDVSRFKFTDAALNIGEWTHVTFAIDAASKQMQCYINGILKQTKPMTDDVVTAFNSVNFTEGNGRYTTVGGSFNWDGKLSHINDLFNGQIASLAAYSRVRTAEEIASDYLDYTKPDKTELILGYIFDQSGLPYYHDVSENANTLSWNGFTYNTKEELTVPEEYDYSMMVVGDTQSLTKRDTPDAYYALYDWLASNIETKKIEAVIGVGDMTNDNTAEQWEKVVTAFSKLDGKVKHFPIAGNHDSTIYGEDPSLFKNYVLFEANENSGSHDGSIDAYYYRFEAGGKKFLFLGVGYDPTEEQRAWAAGIIEDHPNYNVIISTHAYLNGDGSFLNKDGARYVRDELVLPYSNVVLVLCGHMHDSNVRLYTQKREDGTTVQAIFTNPQDFNDSMNYGVVTELYFTDGGKTVNVANYIPSLDAYLGEDSVRSFELDLIETRKKEINVESAIKAEGFSVRMDEYTGLRGSFSFDVSSEAKMKEQGLTLKSYGVIAASYDKLMNTYSGDENALFAAARAVGNDEGAIKYIPVYNSDGSGRNRYLDYATRTFCVSLTNIPSENSLSDIYMAGYVVWIDANGNEYHTLTTYSMPDSVKAANLYEITLGLTKTGVINSENTDDICFWQVLKHGALKTNSFGTVISGATNNYSYDSDGYFTYADVDWHAYSSITSSDGYNFSAEGVSATASGVVWSVLKYTEEEYVLVFRNSDKAAYTSLKLPQSAMGNWVSEYKFYAPYDYRYGQTSNSNTATNIYYNPPISQTDYDKIKTLVVDHGIKGTAAAAFAGLKVETIVYPNGMSDYARYKFAKCAELKNVIWCHEDESGVPVEHMSEFKGLNSLVDLRGYKNVPLYALFGDCRAIENVVFGTADQGTVQSFINGATALKRVWSSSDPMPEEGVLDLSRISIKKLDKCVFNGGSKIKTVMLPDTVTTIVKPKASSAEDYWKILGQGKTYNFVCSDAVQALIVDYVAHIQKTPKDGTPATANYADGIFVNGTAVTTLIAALPTT